LGNWWRGVQRNALAVGPYIIKVALRIGNSLRGTAAARVDEVDTPDCHRAEPEIGRVIGLGRRLFRTGFGLFWGIGSCRYWVRRGAVCLGNGSGGGRGRSIGTQGFVQGAIDVGRGIRTGGLGAIANQGGLGGGGIDGDENNLSHELRAGGRGNDGGFHHLAGACIVDNQGVFNNQKHALRFGRHLLGDVSSDRGAVWRRRGRRLQCRESAEGDPQRGEPEPG
jgi:hypothetical protein